MAASAPLSGITASSPLSTAVDGDGPRAVPDYSPYSTSSAGLPLGLDPDLQAGYVVLFPLLILIFDSPRDFGF